MAITMAGTTTTGTTMTTTATRLVYQPKTADIDIHILIHIRIHVHIFMHADIFKPAFVTVPKRPCVIFVTQQPTGMADVTMAVAIAVAGTGPEAIPATARVPERPSTFAAHHRYTRAVAEHVKNLRVRDKRNIYVAMRLQPDVKTDSFLPHFGLSVADFCVWQTLNEKPRQTTT